MPHEILYIIYIAVTAGFKTETWLFRSRADSESARVPHEHHESSGYVAMELGPGLNAALDDTRHMILQGSQQIT
jgi:hypothetical protein